MLEPGRSKRARKPGALQTSERSDQAARRLRTNSTPAEARLWRELRKMAVTGARFRRQAPIGPYVVDFVCHQARLIVEVDGGIHRWEAVAARDVEREKWLTERGYRVIRITNEQALFDLPGVIGRIGDKVGASTPTPTPPRKGEGLYVGEE